MNDKLAQQIVKIFANNPFDTFNPKQIAARVGAHDKAARAQVDEIIFLLASDEVLVEERRGKYKIHPKHINDAPRNEIVGTIDMKQTGKAYVIPQEEGHDDIQIAPNYTHHALHGDTVRVLKFPQRKMHKPEGEVVEIIKRARTHFVGRIQRTDKFAFLICDNRNMVVDIFIPLADLCGAEDGEKAIVEMVDWPERMNNPVGRVTKRLGRPGDNNVEMQSILADYDFPIDFPEAAEREASKIKAPTKKELDGRKDFREVTTFTIDPADAKDFDDALSFRKLENGNYEIGVHIADVSYYVKPGTLVDKEAQSRGTSVYLVDRTVPMLPEKLSNNLCSLRPDEEKLTFSAVFEMTTLGKVESSWFGRTVIRSDHRFDYDTAQKIIEGGKVDGVSGELSDTIVLLNRLGKISEGIYLVSLQSILYMASKEHNVNAVTPLTKFLRQSDTINSRHLYIKEKNIVWLLIES